MRTLCKVLMVLVVVALLASPALAQRPMLGGFGGVGMFLTQDSVKKELKMTDEQATKCTEALAKARETMKEELAKLRDRDLKPEVRAEIMSKLNEANYKALGDVLKAEQVKRLRQIELQNSGVTIFATPEVEKALDLTKEQKEKMTTLNEEFMKEMRGLFQGGDFEGAMKKMTALRKESMEKAVAALKDDQKKKWKEMTGEPFTVNFEFRRPGGNL